MKNLTMIVVTIISINLVLQEDLEAAIVCENSGSSFGSVVCSNEDESNATSITIARMPRWKFNSGVRLISICNEGGDRILKNSSEVAPNVYKEEMDEGSYLEEDHYNTELRNQEGVHCVRRFCSENIDNFGFVLNGLFIPVSPVAAVSTKYSFYSKNIEIKCKRIKYDPLFKQHL